jgi:8-oxo-dGTP pyrophosphatase MutT (NUDIX family)
LLLGKRKMRKQLTLLLLHDLEKRRVLLAMKKRGFGAGKYNGFGGKIEPKETILGAALREMHEESGGLIPTDTALRGNIIFEFQGSPELLEVHVFKSTEWQDRAEPSETEEMRPEWHAEDAIPYDKMWLDDKYWLPILLKRGEEKEEGRLISAAEGQCFKAHFLFSGHETIVTHKIELLTGPEGLPHKPDAVLVTEVQGPITA